MDTRINNCKTDYSNMNKLKMDVQTIFDTISDKLSKLNSLYNDIINVKNDTLFLFGLDSFFFQNKLLDKELDNMEQLYTYICNRIYGDYYKLYHIIVTFVEKENIHVEIPKKSYPKYLDLQPYKQYSNKDIDNIFNDCMYILLSMYEYVKNQMMDVKNFHSKRDIGININNFVYTYEYNIKHIKHHIKLFTNYSVFFVELHTKYFKQFMIKLKIMYQQMSNDIKLDNETIGKNDFMDELTSEMPNDNDTLLELKKSLYNSASPINNISLNIDEINKETEPSIVKNISEEEISDDVKGVVSDMIDKVVSSMDENNSTCVSPSNSVSSESSISKSQKKRNKRKRRRNRKRKN